MNTDAKFQQAAASKQAAEAAPQKEPVGSTSDSETHPAEEAASKDEQPVNPNCGKTLQSHFKGLPRDWEKNKKKQQNGE